MLAAEASRTKLSPGNTPSSCIIFSSRLPISIGTRASNLDCNTCVKIVSNVDASIGENDSVSPVYAATPAAAVCISADINVASVTLPNGGKPSGCTAFLISLTYVENDCPT